MALTPQKFLDNWLGTTLSERASYQSHFHEVCQMLEKPTPTGSGTDNDGNAYTFEYGVKKDTGGQGFADVYYQNHFAIEYKAPDKYNTLTDALNQLKQYRENLNNPPLLIVTDINHWEIHTNFTNAANRPYVFTHDEVTKPHVQRWLRAIFEDPNRLHPNRTAAEVTADAANNFRTIADNMRRWEAEPDRIAAFLTKLVFCLFAEDIGLLPVGVSGHGIFSEVVLESRKDLSNFEPYMHDLFAAMDKGGKFNFRNIDWFNGSLFKNVDVERLELEAVSALETACKLDWSNIEPAIFGTLFERSLDPGKRAQLGAHYTSRDDIMLIVEPVLMAPLRREWETIRNEAAAVREKLDAADTKAAQTRHRNELEALRGKAIDRVSGITVLDPACGSGNFLYVSLGLLLDLEKAIVTDPVFADAGLTVPQRQVHPKQLFGIEKNVIAHALASIVVWIGYIQWQRDNGYVDSRQPILEDLHENIQLMDAIMTPDGTEPAWPAADVIVGNPPFLGDKKMRGELGDDYVEKLRDLYDGRIKGGADLVTYWFEKAREYIKADKTQRAGLLATQSLRAGANREILKRIKNTGDIFMAWSDRAWVLDGAAVRVSMVGFDDGTEDDKALDGQAVEKINSDLTSAVDVTKAAELDENSDLAFIGTQKGGAFDIDKATAQKLIAADGKNVDVVRPWVNASAITSRYKDMYIINFRDYELEHAATYTEPLDYVEKHVKPKRDKSRDKSSREYWWRFQRARPALYEAIDDLNKYIATPRVAKHRMFVWVGSDVVPDSRVVAIARDDDYFFGVLVSKIHEVWSLKQASWHGVGNDPTYNAQSCFETFPFPWSPGAEDTESAAYAAVRAAAAALHQEREAWLNPADVGLGSLKNRTLTNLYNALVALREQGDRPRDMPSNIKAEAWEFAPRLRELHDALDRAVCDAYGWDHAILDDEEAMLRSLLALNLARADAQA